MTYQNILVPIDGSETSLTVVKHAVDLAKAFNSKITVVQVLTLDPYIAAEYLSNGQSNSLIERSREFIQNNMQAVKHVSKNFDLKNIVTKWLEIYAK